MPIRTVICALASAVLAMPLPSAAAPATGSPQTCKVTGADRKPSYSGPCQVDATRTARDRDADRLRYRLVLPSKLEVEIVLYRNGLALIGKMPAKKVSAPGGAIKLLTAQDETYEFTL